ncbi:MAG: hypothetical protein ABIT96_10950 [Ferruginibacter sp.]
MLFYIVTARAQEHAIFLTDSLIKVNKVKSRSRISLGSGQSAVRDFYDSEGRLTKTENISVADKQVMVTYFFYYNEKGLLVASVGTKSGGFMFFPLLKNGFGENVDTILTRYQYNDSDRLVRIYMKEDHTGLLQYERLLFKNPDHTQTVFYTREGKIKLLTDEFFERENVISKSIVNRYDTTGTLLSQNIQEYENSFNEKGQLISIKYSCPKCNTEKKFEYFSNGLLSRKTKDKCMSNWKYSYSYYK